MSPPVTPTPPSSEMDPPAAAPSLVEPADTDTSPPAPLPELPTLTSIDPLTPRVVAVVTCMSPEAAAPLPPDTDMAAFKGAPARIEEGAPALLWPDVVFAVAQ